MNKTTLNPQERTKRVNEIQKEGAVAWAKNKGIGTLKMCTGIGKTVTAIKCVYIALNQGWIQKGDTIRFWAETIAREKTIFEDELAAVLKYMGEKYNFVEDFKCIFRCYQSGINDDNVAMEIYDEVDYCTTSVYHTCISESKAPLKLGITATNNEVISVMKSELHESFHDKVRQSDKDTIEGNITTFINKGQMLQVLLPVVYEYNLDQAIEEGVLSSYETIIIKHKLDNSEKYVRKSKKDQKRLYTEEGFYELGTHILNAKKMMPNGELKFEYPSTVRDVYSRALTNMLYSAKSKAPVARAIRYLIGNSRKVLVFGHRLELLEQITDNVVTGDNSTELINKFNSGEIKTIASAKVLKRGVTLDGLQDVILVGYFSTSVDLEQTLGRLIRYTYGSAKRIFIIVTQDTFETRWFEKFTKVFNDKGEVIREIDLNVTKQYTSEQIINMAKNKLAKSKNQ